MAIGCNNNETNIADNKELYDIAIQYVIDNDTKGAFSYEKINTYANHSIFNFIDTSYNQSKRSVLDEKHI
jgi:hypothetical protein